MRVTLISEFDHSSTIINLTSSVGVHFYRVGVGAGFPPPADPQLGLLPWHWGLPPVGDFVLPLVPVFEGSSGTGYYFGWQILIRELHCLLICLIQGDLLYSGELSFD